MFFISTTTWDQYILSKAYKTGYPRCRVLSRTGSCKNTNRYIYNELLADEIYRCEAGVEA